MAVSNVLSVYLLLVLSFAGFSQQRTVSGERSTFIMMQSRLEAQKLTRPPAVLANLQVAEGQLIPPFSSYIYNYTVIVPANVDDVHVEAKLAVGKMNDKLRIKIETNAAETDMYGSTLILRRNGSTVLVKVHVSAHKLATSTYFVIVESGPNDTPGLPDDDDVPSSSEDHDGNQGNQEDITWDALRKSLTYVGSTVALCAIAVIIYNISTTLRFTRLAAEEGYQPVAGQP